MKNALVRLICTVRGTQGIGLNIVESTHGTPGFQMSDSKVISRFGFN